MNIIRLLGLCILLLGVSLLPTQAFAAKKPTDKERKERADAEYARCMAVAKNEGIPAMLAYVRKSQKGTSLKGSPEKLAQENCVADGFGLTRHQDLQKIVSNQGSELVPLISPLIKIKNVPEERHVACSWTCGYLVQLAMYMDLASGTKDILRTEPQLTVTSLVRSRVDQNGISKAKKFYRRIKGKLKKFIGGRRSFADCSSKAVCSTHLTGSTVDISIAGVDEKKFQLLEARLLEDRENGRILVILERAGGHFHVFVIPPEYVASTKTPAS